jgi:hypothetical protein
VPIQFVHQLQHLFGCLLRVARESIFAKLFSHSFTVRRRSAAQGAFQTIRGFFGKIEIEVAKRDKWEKRIGDLRGGFRREGGNNKHAYEPCSLGQKGPRLVVETSPEQRGRSHTGKNR